MRNIYDMIKTAFKNAKIASKGIMFGEDDAGKSHAACSREWIAALATELKTSVGVDAQIFYRGNRDNKEEGFEATEILHDITICSIKRVLSSHHKKPLPYFHRLHWQVESEFRRDGSKLLHDFNKLILGSAPNKLFVTSGKKDNRNLLDLLEEPASVCSGNLFLAFIPHPEVWGKKDKPEIEVYRYASGWEPETLESV